MTIPDDLVEKAKASRLALRPEHCVTHHQACDCIRAAALDALIESVNFMAYVEQRGLIIARSVRLEEKVAKALELLV